MGNEQAQWVGLGLGSGSSFKGFIVECADDETKRLMLLAIVTRKEMEALIPWQLHLVPR